jgi:hypothetical protein
MALALFYLSCILLATGQVQSYDGAFEQRKIAAAEVRQRIVTELLSMTLQIPPSRRHHHHHYHVCFVRVNKI